MTDWNRRQWIATAVGITGLAGIEDATRTTEEMEFPNILNDHRIRW